MHRSASQTVSPFYGQSQSGSMSRRLGGVAQYDQSPLSFTDSVDRVRVYDAAGLHPGFADVAGNMAISSFESYQQPPSAWFRPTTNWPAGKQGQSHGGISGHEADDLDASLYKVQCTSNSDCGPQGGQCTANGYCACPLSTGGQFCQFPDTHPTRRNQLMHGM